MKIKFEFVKNFLTHKKYRYGELISSAWITLSFVFSLFYWDRAIGVSDKLAARLSLIESGELWRLLTTIFVHGDLAHLLSNTLMLFILSYFMFSFFGFIQGVIIPLGFGMAINYISLLYYPENTVIVGASGVVYYFWGFWLVMYCFIQSQHSKFLRFLISGAVFLVLLVPTKYAPNTSYFAHYIGLILGGIYAIVFYLLKRKYLKSHVAYNLKLEEDQPVDFEYGPKQEEYKHYY